jgi:hypothetical protein
MMMDADKRELNNEERIEKRRTGTNAIDTETGPTELTSWLANDTIANRSFWIGAHMRKSMTKEKGGTNDPEEDKDEDNEQRQITSRGH